MEHTHEQLTDFAGGKPILDSIGELYWAWEGGQVDALAFYITLNRIEKHLAAVKEEVKPFAIEQAGLWNEKSFSYFGATIEKKSGPGRWDFKGVQAWNEAKATISAIEERAKAAAQMAQKFGAATVSEDGELIEGAVYTPGSDIIAIKGL
jgi:hypothetical protein